MAINSDLHRRRRRRRVLVLVVGCAIVLALSAPHLIAGWNAFAERAASRPFYAPRDFERDTYEAGQKLDEQKPRLTGKSVERIFNQYIKRLKIEAPDKPLRSISRNSFLAGQGKRAAKEKEKTKP